MLACITGGYNIKERLRCITELKGLGVAGYVLEGFHTNGESATNLSWEDLEPVLTETLVGCWTACVGFKSSTGKMKC